VKKTILSIIALVFMLALGVFSFYGSISGVKGLYKVYLQYKYPLKFNEEVLKHSTEFGLEPELVSAVIYEESRFRPDSSSEKGAKGLMQLLPDTAEYIAKNIGDSDYNDNEISDTDTNIRYGCYYLSYLYKKYGDWSKALAAYNAGEGNVDLWLKEGDYQVKFEETKNFVDRVNLSKSMYKKIYFTN